MAIGERLKTLRLEQGLTQAEFAEKLGFPLPTYRQYERGVRKPKVDVIRHICNTFNKDVMLFAEDYLLTDNKKNNLFYFLLDDKPELAFKLTKLEFSQTGSFIHGNKLGMLSTYDMMLLRSALLVVFGELEKE